MQVVSEVGSSVPFTETRLPEPGDRFLTPKEVSDILAVNEQTIRRMLRDGSMPGVRIGRHWRVSLKALERWVEAGGTGPEDEGQAE